MKRKANLYENTYKMENIIAAFNEVCKHTKNKRKVRNYKQYRCIYISRIYRILKNRSYKVGPYNVFMIYEPKQRRIVSQALQDKVINHIVSRQILYPSVMPCLIPENVASRENMGTQKGLKLACSFHRKCKVKYGMYYILKCDIAKYFESIDKEILKRKVAKKIKDKEALNIVFEIIDSEEKGLGIGNMTSQILAIFYLNDLDHYIKEVLKIKYYVRYQDDFLLFHQSKEYLKECFSKIKAFLKEEKLELNKKSRIYKSTDNFVFLGRDKNGKYAKYRTVRRRIKKKYKEYETGKLSLHSLVGSLRCFNHLQGKK